MCRFASLLSCGASDRRELLERRLDRMRHQLADAAGSELTKTRAMLESQWATRLTDLLDEDPRAEADLRSLLAEVQDMLPVAMPAAVEHSVSAGRDVTVTADSGGIAAALIDGPVGPPAPTCPGTASRHPELALRAFLRRAP